MLTAKQEKFVQGLVSGLSQRQAYRQAYPNADECPKLPYEAMDSNNLLYDLIYNPDETLFMKKGMEHGAVVKNGLEMLLLQAFVSWEFWNSED